MIKIPTAEDFFYQIFSNNNCHLDYDKAGLEVIKEVIIEFTKLHVQEALFEANSKVTIDLVEYSKFGGKIINTLDVGQEVPTENSQQYLQVNKDSILNAYPLENIK